jgi:glycosyltransferase involved in cell wall biosynthesis
LALLACCLHYSFVIGLYCPDLPPTPGGVADQTLMIARTLEQRGVPCTVLGRRGDASLFAPLPVRLGVTPATLRAAVHELGIRGLYVQYVPFLYARRGVAPSLCPSLRRVLRDGTRVALFVHEPFVPFTRLPWLVTGVLQRLQLRCLVRAVDRVYAPVPRYAAICRSYARDPGTVTAAPIGANFDPSTMSRETARAALGLADGAVTIGVFSPAAAGYRLDWVEQAMRRLAARGDVTWIVFGFGSDRLFADAPPNVRRLGALDRTRVADTARALDLFVAPYRDGLTMRRGGAMLGLRAGVPLVSSTGHLYDPDLAAYAACEPDAAAFAARLEQLVHDPGARAALADRAARSAPVSAVETLGDMIVKDLAA